MLYLPSNFATRLNLAVLAIFFLATSAFLSIATEVRVVLTQTAIPAATAGETCLAWCGVRSRRDAR